MTLDPDKTLITRIDQGFEFIGYTVKMQKPKHLKITLITYKTKKKIQRFPRRTTSRKINIYPSSKRITRNLQIHQFCRGSDDFPIAKRSWIILDEFEIVLKYRQIMIGLTNDSQNCSNHRILNRASYILQYSCAKTLAARKKRTMGHIFKEYGKDLKITRQFYTKDSQYTRAVTFPTLTTLRKAGKLTYHKHKSPIKDPFRIFT